MKLVCDDCGSDLKFDVHQLGFDVALKFKPCKCILADIPDCDNCSNLAKTRAIISQVKEVVNSD